MPYTASKSSLIGLTRGLAIEWTAENILVNSVSPGWFFPNMTRGVIDEERKSKILKRIPLGRFAETEESAALVSFLDSPDRRIRLTITYPASTGRNFDEILRSIDSLQLTDKFSVSTPVNWKRGEDVVIAPSIQNEAELKQKFPKGYKTLRPYLRLTPQPDID